MSDDVLNSLWAAQLFPVVQAVKCNLTALQHSFEVSLLRMAVAMRHLVLHDKYQVMRRLDVEAALQRQLEPDQPTSGRTLIDCPIDTVLLL